MTAVTDIITGIDFTAADHLLELIKHDKNGAVWHGQDEFRVDHGALYHNNRFVCDISTAEAKAEIQEEEDVINAYMASWGIDSVEITDDGIKFGRSPTDVIPFEARQRAWHRISTGVVGPIYDGAAITMVITDNGDRSLVYSNGDTQVLSQPYLHFLRRYLTPQPHFHANVYEALSCLQCNSAEMYSDCEDEIV